MSEGAALAVKGLSVTYPGGGVGLANLDLALQPGEIVALLGRNGAGKTTALRGISGFLRSEGASVTGSASVAGAAVAGRPPYRAFSAGVYYVPERDKVFPALTVLEHWQIVSKAVDVAMVVAEFPQLANHRDAKANALSGGQRQLLALSMAWLARPRVLLVDEASLGLAPIATQGVAKTIASMADKLSTGVIVVDQETSPTIDYAHRLVVLQHGHVIWQGSRDEISSSALRAAIIGEAHG